MKKIYLVLVAAALVALSACGNNASKKSEPAADEPAVAEDDMSQYAPDAKVGSQAFVFELPDSEGFDFSLSSYRGNYAIIDFWASWCPDCVREIPAVKDLYAEFNPKGVQFVSVSFDHEEDSWRKMLAQADFGWTQVCNLIKWKENPINDAYGLHWIPTLILVDPQGNIAGYALTAEDMKAQLETILK